MTDEQLNIAVCEWRGWKDIEIDYDSDGELTMWRGKRDGDSDYAFLPSHITDLNAMHEAEDELHPSEIDPYIELLGKIVREHWVSKDKNAEAFTQQSVIFAHANATARQRATALLRVVRPGLFMEEAT